MNNRGRGSGMALVLLLIVALIVAWLVVKSGAITGMGNGAAMDQRAQSPVQAAQNAVDALNDRLRQAATEP